MYQKDKKIVLTSCLYLFLIFKNYTMEKQIFNKLLFNSSIIYSFILNSILYQKQFLNRMKIFRHAKDLLVQADLFRSAQMLRYKSDADYKTMTGGIISLITVIAVVVGFSNMIISTMERTSISSKLEVKKTGDPSRMQLIGGQDNFMFGLFVQTLDVSTTFDLLKGPHFFDIVMREVVIENGMIPQYKSLNLEPCTREHWKMEENVLKNYDNYQVQKWLCPKLKQKYELSGIYGSTFYSFLEFSLYPCTNTSENNNKCAPQTEIDQLFATKNNFYITLSYINPVINPNQVQHLKYYYETQNYLIFSKTIGTELWIYLSDFTIESDNNILPFQSVQTKKGYIGEQLGSKFTFSVSSADNNRLASIFFAKSRNSLVYSREVLKVSEVISYVGGLISALAGVLFIFKLYTDTSFQFNICSQIFHKQRPNTQRYYLNKQDQLDKEEREGKEDREGKGDIEDKEVKEEQQKTTSQVESQNKERILKFNFKTFMTLCLYKVLKFFKKGQSLKDYQKILDYQAEINKQLDIRILLNRILKIQLYMSEFFREQNLQLVKDYKEITCEKAKYLRTLLNSEETSLQTSHLLQNNSNSEQPRADSFKNSIKLHDDIQPSKQNSANGLILPVKLHTKVNKVKFFENIHTQCFKEPDIVIFNENITMNQRKVQSRVKNAKGNFNQMQDMVIMRPYQREESIVQVSAKDIIQLTGQLSRAS